MRSANGPPAGILTPGERLSPYAYFLAFVALLLQAPTLV